MSELYDVAIVGYGPSGVVAANLLAKEGLRVYVCDRLPDVYEIPRAISLDHEIQRVFQQLGVLDAIAPYCEPFTPSEYYGVEGQLIRRMTMVEPPYPLGHVPSVVFSQPPVEKALRAHAAKHTSLTLELGVEMTRLEQDADAVDLHLVGAALQTRVRARYVIACDGGASGVRSQLGISLEDLDFDEPWLVVDVRVNERGLARLPRVSVQYCEPERPCTLVIGPGNHRRWEISLKADEVPQEMATPESTWRLLSRWLSPEEGELWRQASYRFHALVADRWRVGRVFLAGDAAHMQPPFLGQGMCQGIRDVANLSWKLAAVLKGQVSSSVAERLLDSYGQERKAHVQELTCRLKEVGAVICERDPVKAKQRDEWLLAQAGGVVRDMPRQDVLPRLESGWLSKLDHPARGTLFPQPRLLAVGGNTLMDEHLGYGWRLISIVPVPSSPFNLSLLVLGESANQEAEGVVAQWMQRYGVCAALVRPDHYVYGVAADSVQLQELVTEWYAQQEGVVSCELSQAKVAVAVCEGHTES